MDYIRQPGSLLLPQPDTFPPDKELLESLLEAHSTDKEAYQELGVSTERKQAAIDAWESGQEADLTMDPVKESELLARIDSLKAWKQNMLESDIDPDIKQVYRWKVNEMIGSVHMMIASARGDMKGFRHWNKFVYGEPDEQIYRGALDWVAHDAENLLSIPDQHPATKEAAQRVLDILEGKRGYREILMPDNVTFEAVRNDHLSKTGYYGLVLADVEIPEGKITPTVGDPILLQMIRNIGSNKQIIDSEGATWSVDAKGFRRPSKYNMLPARLTGLSGHEISHEVERINGNRGPLSLAATGLDRYELGNEGRALIREQVLYKTFAEFGKIVRWRDVMRRHIAISYAWGVGEESPKSTLETYNFINMIDLMYQTKLKPDNPEAAQEGAKKKTGNLLTRVLKGGDAYLKDKVYLEGNVACWLTAALHSPRAIADGDLGKFDINSPRHIKILQDRGLLPVEV